MPTTFAIEGTVVTVTCEGEFDIDDARAIVNWLREEPTVPDVFKLLILDLGTSFSPSTEQLEGMASDYGTIADRIVRWALVVEKNYHFGLGRMFSVFAERQSFEMRVFADGTQAREWLEEPPDTDP